MGTDHVFTLTEDEIDMITAFMETRTSDPVFATSCEKMI